MKLTLISAGQTGADYGALLAAKELNLNIKGYANKGWRTEKGSNLELKDLGLLENDKPSCASTDQKNVNLADVLIAFRYSSRPGRELTGRGTECTVNYALTKKYKHVILDQVQNHQIYEGKKPVIVFWDLSKDNMEDYSIILKSFLDSHQNIMISGPCQSTVDCESLVKDLLCLTFSGEI